MYWGLRHADEEDEMGAQKDDQDWSGGWEMGQRGRVQLLQEYNDKRGNTVRTQPEHRAYGSRSVRADSRCPQYILEEMFNKQQLDV